MAKETRPFDGHFDGDDPRYVTTAAGGCDWPTIPAYRFMLMSDNATQAWAWLRMPSTLFQRTSPITVHDECTWGLHSALFPVSFAFLQRSWLRDQNIIRWRVELHTIHCLFPAVAFFNQAPGPCNGEVQLGEMTCIAAPGTTGSHLKLIPVQFDKTEIE